MERRWTRAEVFGVEVCEVAELDVGAELVAVAAEVLVEEGAFDGGAGDTAGLGLDVGAEEEEGWAGFFCRRW